MYVFLLEKTAFIAAQIKLSLVNISIEFITLNIYRYALKRTKVWELSIPENLEEKNMTPRTVS